MHSACRFPQVQSPTVTTSNAPYNCCRELVSRLSRSAAAFFASCAKQNSCLLVWIRGCSAFWFCLLPFLLPLWLTMAGTEMNVRYVAHLARLDLSPEEEQKFGAQLGNVLGYIEKLNELDVSHVEPTAHAVPMVNVTRPDEARPSIS